MALLALVLPGAGYVAAEAGPAGVRAAPSASGSIGAVDIELDGVRHVIPPVAECRSGVVPETSTAGTGVPDFVQFDDGSTRCTASVVAWRWAATVTGGTFELPGLREYGGPMIRMRSYRVTCSTTVHGTEGRFQFNGLSGFSVPPVVPRNHVVTIPGPDGSPPLARVTMHEVVPPTPPDGSISLNLMRIELFPQTPGAPATGDIVVGAVRCDPN